MLKHTRQFRHAGLLMMIGAVMIAFAAAPARAREEASTGFMAADESMIQKLLHLRTREELATELESARRRLSAAGTDLSEMEAMGTVITARLDVKKQEIELIKQRVRLAKMESDAPKAAALDLQRKQEEKQLGVFEAMRESAATQIDRARAARDFAQIRIDLQEAELELLDKREARVARATGPADASRAADLTAMDQRISKSSRKVLSTIREYARRSERLAKTTEALAKCNGRLLDLWEEYQGK